MGLEDGMVDQKMDVRQISTNAESVETNVECLLYNGPSPIKMLASLGNSFVKRQK